MQLLRLEAYVLCPRQGNKRDNCWLLPIRSDSPEASAFQELCGAIHAPAAPNSVTA